MSLGNKPDPLPKLNSKENDDCISLKRCQISITKKYAAVYVNE